MFNWFKKKEQTPAEVKIDVIINMLFPPQSLKIDKNGNKYHIDYSADSNLDAALNDLEEGHNDEASRATIKGVADKLFKLRKFLNIQQKFDKEAKAIIVDILESEDIDNIHPKH